MWRQRRAQISDFGLILFHLPKFPPQEEREAVTHLFCGRRRSLWCKAGKRTNSTNVWLDRNCFIKKNVRAFKPVMTISIRKVHFLSFTKGAIRDFQYFHIHGIKKNWYGFFFPSCCLHLLVLSIFETQDSATVVTKIAKTNQTHLFEYEKVEMKSYTKDNSLDLPPAAAWKLSLSSKILAISISSSPAQPSHALWLFS